MLMNVFKGDNPMALLTLCLDFYKIDVNRDEYFLAKMEIPITEVKHI